MRAFRRGCARALLRGFGLGFATGAGAGISTGTKTPGSGMSACFPRCGRSHSARQQLPLDDAVDARHLRGTVGVEAGARAVRGIAADDGVAVRLGDRQQGLDRVGRFLKVIEQAQDRAHQQLPFRCAPVLRRDREAANGDMPVHRNAVPAEPIPFVFNDTSAGPMRSAPAHHLEPAPEAGFALIPCDPSTTPKEGTMQPNTNSLPLFNAPAVMVPPAAMPFVFEGAEVRVVMRDGAPWFVLADVCRVLSIGNAVRYREAVG